VGLLSLRPGDLLPILKDGFRRSASSALFSSADATQAKGLLAFTPVGLPPTEHVYLSWTHSFAKLRPALILAPVMHCYGDAFAEEHAGSTRLVVISDRDYKPT
jgi:hypothetical protein